MFSDRLRLSRQRAGLSQRELSQIIHISQQTYSKYENNITTPNPETLSLIADALGVSSDYLLGRTALLTPSDDGVMEIDSRALSDALFSGAPVPSLSRTQIPVYGRVAAGIPIEAVEDVIDVEEITPEMAKNGRHIALQIHGDSMEPRMRDGDVVIVRLQDDAETGDTAVVMVNGTDATCKKIKKMPDGIMLISTNPAYEPMYYTNDQIASLPIRILGRVVELRAKF